MMANSSTKRMIRIPTAGFAKLKVLVLFLLLWTSFGSASAQTWPFELWHEGRVILLQGDTLKGLVKYDLQQDIVQLTNADKTVEAYSARKILFFEIFDNTVHRYRQFFALPYTTAGNYRAPVFFELLEEGKLTLLAREALEYRTYYTGFYGGSYQRLVLIHKYFFIEENGNINEFTGNKNDLLAKMGNRGEDVEKFTKANKLKYDEKYDLAKIVAYYNSFFKT